MRLDVADLRCRITLTCGHAIATRERPWNPGNRYACTAGLGCGYRLPWVSYRVGEHTGRNPELNPPPDPDPPPAAA